MIPELSILRLCLKYEQWRVVSQRLDTSDLPKELQGIYRVLNSFHESNESGADLSVSDLANLFFSTRPKDFEYYQTVFSQIEKQDAREDTTLKLLSSIQQAKLLRELSLDAYDSAEGRVSIEKVKEKISSLQQLMEDSNVNDDVSNSVACDFVTDDLEVLVNETLKKPGLRWRLGTLNRMLGSLRTGDFGFIFARPETGKTTFLVSEVTHMAKQSMGPILWCNNEEQGNKVMLRCYQAALGIDMPTLFSNLEGNKKKYHELTKGNIRIYDNASIHKHTVERVCRQIKPSLIIFDQIDKIVGFDSDREDLRLGKIYQWAREIAKQYAPVIAVCQADGSGEGQKWLTMANVANAKTAKQAEADWILGIGKMNEPGYDQLRYLHLSKNKLMGDEDSDASLRHGRRECIINAEIARYEDIS